MALLGTEPPVERILKCHSEVTEKVKPKQAIRRVLTLPENASLPTPSHATKHAIRQWDFVDLHQCFFVDKHLGSPVYNELIEGLMAYKKMAGTAAVFIRADRHSNSPVERDGLMWNAEELHLTSLPAHLTEKDPMATSLALEGLECYDPPAHGDRRAVTALNTDFAYVAAVKGWVELDTP